MKLLINSEAFNSRVKPQQVRAKIEAKISKLSEIFS